MVCSYMDQRELAIKLVVSPQLMCFQYNVYLNEELVNRRIGSI